jgi:hypothetical protein
LSEGEGEKEISVQVKDEAGNESEVYSKKVVMDKTGPTGSIKVLNLEEDRGIKFVSEEYVEIEVSGSDSISGIEGMKIWDDRGTEPGEWVRYVSNMRWRLSEGDGDKEIRVKLRDNAGNESGEEIRVGFKKVTVGDLVGKVRLEGGVDNSGVVVSLVNTNYSGVSGMDGGYKIEGVKAGEYDVVFSKVGYKSVIIRGVKVKGYWGGEIGEVGMVKARGYVYGNVQLEGSRNNSGVVITLMPGGYVGYSLSDGTYRVENIPVGVYSVEMYREGYSKYSKSGVEVKEDVGTEIENVLLKSINTKVQLVDNSAGNPFNTKYSKSRQVDVVITPPDKYGKVCVAEDVNYDGKCKPEDSTNPNYVIYNPVDYQNFELSDRDGEKVVYVRFLDENNANPLEIMEGKTILDRGSPEVSLVEMNGGDKYINKSKNTGEVVLKMVGRDVTSGIYQYRYRFEGGNWSSYRDYVSEVIVPYEPAGVDGDKVVYVQLRDFAGNESNELDIKATAKITVDTLEPQGTGISVVADAVDSNNV